MASPDHRSQALTVGVYGKFPSHGDFLRRRVSDAFVAAWDTWLQESIVASRKLLGDQWLEFYLTSPVWRFVCTGGVCGPDAVVGLMVPSVDGVGRYFPLTLVAELPPAITVVEAIRQTESFLAAVEQLVIDGLESNAIEFDSFDSRLLALAEQHGAIRLPFVHLDPSVAAEMDDEQGRQAWHISVGSPGQLASVFEQLTSHRLSALFGPSSIWWTEGSSAVDASALVVSGLPFPESFAAFLDGSWHRHDLKHVALAVEPDPEAGHTGDTVVHDLIAPRFRSAAASHVGRVRKVNQDSYIEMAETGLWAVADGLGGLSDGEVASRMVCDALADLAPESTFEQTLDSARRRLEDVNGYLHRKSIEPTNPTRSGSTVVAMFVRDWQCAVLWAGDSRVYRWRSGQLEQLTRDHSVAEEEGSAAPEDSNVVTRAIGGEPLLSLDVVYHRVQVGDRFLMCSDGLTRVVPEARIGELVGNDGIRAAVDGLITATLDGGAPDNATALLVEAFS